MIAGPLNGLESFARLRKRSVKMRQVIGASIDHPFGLKISFSIGGVKVVNAFHWILSVTMQLTAQMDQMKSP